MALLTTQTITRTGITPTYAAVTASDTLTPDKETFIQIKNAGGSSDTVTVEVRAGDPVGLTISDLSISVPATTGDRMIGPLPPQFFADPTTGLCTVTHSFITSVTAGVFKLSQP